jgi:hypothetical protein
MLATSEVVLGLFLVLFAGGLVLAILVGLLAINSKSTTTSTGRPPDGGRPPSTATDSTAKYRTQDGTQDYAFQFKRLEAGAFRVYILEQPGYDGRDASCHTTHRLRDASGFFICWSVPITTFEDAKQIAAKWAEMTEIYRNTGRRF